MNITRISSTLLAVDSETTEGTSYTVNLAGQGSCSCPHHQVRGAHCKHIQRAEAFVAALEAPKAEPALQRAQRTAQGLSDAELRAWLGTYSEGPVAGAIRMEMAQRQIARQAKPIPEGVLVLLEGVTEAERARALEAYR